MYSHRLLKDIIGLDDVEDGVVRISMLHYNTGQFISTFNNGVLMSDRARNHVTCCAATAGHYSDLELFGGSLITEGAILTVH